MAGVSRASNILDRNGLCLLSLDGGGVRGLSTLLILHHIMIQLSRERGSLSILKPCEVFDLIGGTSTGGLIAIMLGRLQMSTEDCIQAYTDLIRTVFGKKLRSVPVDWTGSIRPRYDSEKLRLAVQEVIVKAGAAPDDLMDDGSSRGCRVFVCTTAKDTLQVTRLRSYSVSNEEVSATICEAALATSAATGFFEYVSIGNSQYVDGAFGANNPVEEVEEEAADIWCTSSRDLKPLVKCFLSLGTGSPSSMPMDDNMIKFLSKTLVRMATKPESTERRFMARWSNETRQKRIFRFNVEKGLQEVHMSDYQKLSLIETATHNYLHHADQKGRIRDCIVNLAGKRAKTEPDFHVIIQAHQASILKQTLQRCTPTGASTTPEKHPLWFVPFDRNAGFVDLELLETLKQKLFSKTHSPMTGIFGLGGVGKTQLVLELAYQVRDMYPDCSIIWIPAMDKEQFQQTYVKVAHQMAIVPSDGDQEDVKSLVHEYLSRPQNGNWLLIIDNADDFEMWTNRFSSSSNASLAQLLPQSPHGRIVFTTRSMRLAQHLAPRNIVEALQMDESRATRLLGNALINKALITEDRDTTRRLLEQLTFLPLAIVQAATFINENRISIARYIEILGGHAQGAIDLLSEEFEDEGRYQSARNPIASTWLTSFQQIQKADPTAADCLAFMSCVSANDIPTCLLPVADEVKREKAIGLLKSYSFVRCNANGRRLDLHRLVQLATINWLRSENLMTFWQKKSVTILARQYPCCDVFQRSDWRAAIPHALHVLQSSMATAVPDEVFQLMGTVAHCYDLDGRFKEAKPLRVMLRSMLQSHIGTRHPKYLAVQSALARTDMMIGNYGESIQAFESVIESYKNAGQLQSPDAMEAIHRLSTCLRLEGSLQRAEELGSQALRWNLHSRGPYAESTLDTMINMTWIYFAQARVSDAEQMAQESLHMAKSTLGPDHPYTTLATSSLAWISLEQWKLKQAEDLLLDTLERGRRITGPNYPLLLNDLYQLALVTKFQGRHDDAVLLLKKCCVLQEQTLGVDHCRTRNSVRTLEEWTTMRYLPMRYVSLVPPIARSAMILARRRRYPRIKVLGGLYAARREHKDSSLVQEIIRVVQSFREDYGMPCDTCYPIDARLENHSCYPTVPKGDFKRP
ncbi:Acyl transferase/acyl hydrolase/lysophospholipase [Penicillium diatomitis]|uniref:Acyl transferase/acyl hydrolase/lysophospholipase n=1 Tax=Penicillium diatomitis TaxID=2819901 RepID=A0A9W9WTN2_9EURO|nr:Acyl transferase/acyl hydrolase/lysophospholipase [Penicillium diatomitis]KAJ5475322.1 Acyl transferase/acyl hydrolase/lysophospholipase [Penicillium diatomitis]